MNLPAWLTPILILPFAVLAGLGLRAQGRTAPASVPSISPAASSEYPGQKEFDSCNRLPAGKPSVKLTLKPETDVADLIGWVSTITCTPLLVPASVGVHGRRVTLIAPEVMTPDEAYHLFLAALDSVNLTVEPRGKFLTIVEARSAR
jgi:hypothetical protein